MQVSQSAATSLGIYLGKDGQTNRSVRSFYVIVNVIRLNLLLSLCVSSTFIVGILGEKRECQLLITAASEQEPTAASTSRQLYEYTRFLSSLFSLLLSRPQERTRQIPRPKSTHLDLCKGTHLEYLYHLVYFEKQYLRCLPFLSFSHFSDKREHLQEYCEEFPFLYVRRLLTSPRGYCLQCCHLGLRLVPIA